MLMKTFAEWAAETHPDDDMLNEFLGDLAQSRLGKAVRAGVTAGALAFGAGHAGDATAAMPMVPSISNEGISQKPFSRDFLLSLAEEMGASPKKLGEMSDFDLWHWQQSKLTKIESEMARHSMARRKGAFVGSKEWPMWYIKFGTYYGWKAPAAPKHQTEER